MELSKQQIEAGIKAVMINESQTLPKLFLQKLELLTLEERAVLIKSIHWFNNPLFKVDDKK
jgi:hypothetical protein